MRMNVRRAFSAVQRAYAEFLGVPTLVIVAFLLLAVGTYYLDWRNMERLATVATFLQAHIFSNVEATAQLLRTIAGGLMTVTSVTISILLLALQESAGAMTTSVFDQFLRRRHNQFYFGFFVGLTLYALITLATVNEPFNPVIGGATTLVLTIVALFLLIVLLYTTVNQIRPTQIIDTIHHHTLAARRRQLDLLARTRREPSYPGVHARSFQAENRGMVTDIGLDGIGAAIKSAGVPLEVVVHAPVGAYVAYRDPIATVYATTPDAAESVIQALEEAVVVGPQRDITTDPEYGIQQLTNIAWSSISSAKSDISPGLLTIFSLRDILARWAEEAEEMEGNRNEEEVLPVVYPDNAFRQLFDALEALAVVSSESMQFQAFTQVVRTLAHMFDRLSEDQQRYSERVILRLLSALGDHVLTVQLDQALAELADTLHAADRDETADAVEQARAELARTIGTLSSRTARVPLRFRPGRADRDDGVTPAR